MPDGLWGIAIRELTPASRLEFLRLKWISGEPKQPHYFWESDVAKWVEGLWYAIDKNAHTDERRLQSVACIDEPVKLIEGAQLPDVYINVYYTVVEPTQRWTNVIKTHELYCAGHLLEAAVLHFTVTQSTRFLDVMCRYVDYIGSFFGPGEGQLHGYPGHQELELALMRLYKVRQAGISRACRILHRGKRKFFDAQAVARGEDPKEKEKDGYIYFPS